MNSGYSLTSTNKTATNHSATTQSAANQTATIQSFTTQTETNLHATNKSATTQSDPNHSATNQLSGSPPLKKRKTIPTKKRSQQNFTKKKSKTKSTKKISNTQNASRQWKKLPFVSNSKVVLSDSEPVITQETKNILKNPLDSFYAMVTTDLLAHITEQTNLYACQQGKNLNASQNEVAALVAIILLSGYCKVPYRDLYWSVSPDTHNEAVANAMSRNRFREIFSCLHLANNLEMNTDIYFKARPLFDKLNLNFKKYFNTNNYSIDESMIPYYGKHGTKQFIRGKPIRFGFKLWCLASSDGYLFHAEPYCGSDTKLRDTGLGQGGDVVLSLIEKCNLQSGSCVTFDNLFTSLPLLDMLSELGIGGLGTIRPNRLQNAAVASKQVMKKTTRGSYDCAVDDHGNAVVVWHDAAIVTCASNYAASQPVTSIKRWSKTQKKKSVFLCHMLRNCTTKGWEALICLINSWQRIELASVLKNGGGVLCMETKCFHDECLAVVSKSSWKKYSVAFFHDRNCYNNFSFLPTY